MAFRLKAREKVDIDKKDIAEVIRKELKIYMTREDLKQYLADIEHDKDKKRLWNSMTPAKKLKLLRYAAEKRRKK